MSNIEEGVQKSRHLAIQLHHEINKVWNILLQKIRTGDVDDLADFELIRSFMLLGSVVEGTALDLKDAYLALGTLGITKHGPTFVNKIKEDMENARVHPGETPPALICSCSECSTVAMDMVQMAKDIVEKALKNGKEPK